MWSAKIPSCFKQLALTSPQTGEETWLPTEQEADYTPEPSWTLRRCNKHDTAAVNCFASDTGTCIFSTG